MRRVDLVTLTQLGYQRSKTHPTLLEFERGILWSQQMSKLIPRRLNQPPQCHVFPRQPEKKEYQHVLFNKWRVDVWVTSQSTTVWFFFSFFFSIFPFVEKVNAELVLCAVNKLLIFYVGYHFLRCFFMGCQAFPRLCPTILTLFTVLVCSGRKMETVFWKYQPFLPEV